MGPLPKIHTLAPTIAILFVSSSQSIIQRFDHIERRKSERETHEKMRDQERRESPR